MIEGKEFRFVGYKDGVLTCDMGARMHDFSFMPDSDTEIVVSKHFGDHESDSALQVVIVPSKSGKFHDLVFTAISHYVCAYGVVPVYVKNDMESYWYE